MSRLHNNDAMLGGQDLSRCAHVLCWKSIGALSLSVSARAWASPVVWHAGPAGCMLGNGARDSASFDPQHAGAPFCDVICIRSIGSSGKLHPWTRHFIQMYDICSNSNIISNPNSNPNPNLNPYPTPNQKHNDHYPHSLCCRRYLCRSSCRRSQCRITLYPHCLVPWRELVAISTPSC